MNLCLLPNEDGFYIPVLYSILKKIKKTLLVQIGYVMSKKSPTLENG